MANKDAKIAVKTLLKKNYKLRNWPNGTLKILQSL